MAVPVRQSVSVCAASCAVGYSLILCKHSNKNFILNIEESWNWKLRSEYLISGAAEGKSKIDKIANHDQQDCFLPFLPGRFRSNVFCCENVNRDSFK